MAPGRGARCNTTYISTGKTAPARMAWPLKPVKSSAALPTPQPIKASLDSTTSSMPPPYHKLQLSTSRHCLDTSSQMAMATPAGPSTDMSAVKEIAFHQFIITTLIDMQAALCHDWQGTRGDFQDRRPRLLHPITFDRLYFYQESRPNPTRRQVSVPMVLLMLAAHHALPAHISQGEPEPGNKPWRPFTDALRRMTFFVTLSFLKGNMMNSNQKGDQGNKQSGSGLAATSSRAAPGQGSKQGGTHEQHVEAGRQSHKNDGNKQSGSSDSKHRAAAAKAANNDAA